MIEVKISRFRVEAKGHAGYADFGQDIVCAAMSTIFTIAAEMALRMKRDGLTMAEPGIHLKSGDVLIELEPRPEAKEKADWLWEFMRAGCQLMAETYPQYVVITEA